MTLYVKTTADEYKLPLAVAESKRELARILGISYGCVKSSYSKGLSTYSPVEVDDIDKE